MKESTKDTIVSAVITLVLFVMATTILNPIVMTFTVRDLSANNMELLKDNHAISKLNAELWQENLDLKRALVEESKSKCKLNSPVNLPAKPKKGR